MGTFQIDIINPKAAKLLSDLAELNLIKITELSKKSGKDVNTYPFRPQFLKHNNVSYILREKLDNPVSFEDNQYIISNNELGISVWGHTRDEAEEAFAFAFHALYNNYAKETDKKLTTQAKKLKRTLLKLVVSVRDNHED